MSHIRGGMFYLLASDFSSAEFWTFPEAPKLEHIQHLRESRRPNDTSLETRCALRWRRFIINKIKRHRIDYRTELILCKADCRFGAREARMLPSKLVTRPHTVVVGE